MIIDHQPKRFPKDLIVALSSVEDGPMKYLPDSPEDIRANRVKFLSDVGIDMAKTNLLRVIYEGNNYCRYAKFDPSFQGISMEQAHDAPAGDAMMSDQLGQAIFLLVADCCPMVVASLDTPAFMVSHLGRHNVEQDGALKSIQAFCDAYHLETKRLEIWLGPMVGKQTYPLTNLGGQGLEEVIRAQLKRAGIKESQIESSDVDTATDHRYYSHSEFLKGNRQLDGRQVVVAMRRSIS